jgi:hypothetical protein
MWTDLQSVSCNVTWYGLGHNGAETKKSSFHQIQLCRLLPTLSPENRYRCSSQNVVLFSCYETLNIAQNIINLARNIRPSESFRIEAVISSTYGDYIERRILDETADVSQTEYYAYLRY